MHFVDLYNPKRCSPDPHTVKHTSLTVVMSGWGSVLNRLMLHRVCPVWHVKDHLRSAWRRREAAVCLCFCPHSLCCLSLPLWQLATEHDVLCPPCFIKRTSYRRVDGLKYMLESLSGLTYSRPIPADCCFDWTHSWSWRWRLLAHPSPPSGTLPVRPITIRVVTMKTRIIKSDVL